MTGLPKANSQWALSGAMEQTVLLRHVTSDNICIMKALWGSGLQSQPLCWEVNLCLPSFFPHAIETRPVSITDRTNLVVELLSREYLVKQVLQHHQFGCILSTRKYINHHPWRVEEEWDCLWGGEDVENQRR